MSSISAFQSQMESISRLILRANAHRDILQQRQDAEAEDIQQIADWNANIAAIEAIPEADRSAEQTVDLAKTEALRDLLQTRMTRAKNLATATAAIVPTHGVLEEKVEATPVETFFDAVENDDEDEEHFDAFAGRRRSPEDEIRHRLAGKKTQGKVLLSEPVVKRLFSVLLHFGAKFDGQYVGRVIQNSSWAQVQPPENMKFHFDEADGTMKAKSTTVAEGFAKPPTNFELGLGVPHPMNRAEFLVVLGTLRQQAEQVVNDHDRPEHRDELYAFVRQVCRAFHQVLENSLAPSASSTGGKAVFEAIHTKGHGINGITVLRDEGLAFGQVWCEVAAVAGAFRGEYQRLLLTDRAATVSDIARDHGELGAEGHLDMRVLRHSHVYKDLLIPKQAKVLLKAMTEESFVAYNQKHQKKKNA